MAISTSDEINGTVLIGKGSASRSVAPWSWIKEILNFSRPCVFGSARYEWIPGYQGAKVPKSLYLSVRFMTNVLFLACPETVLLVKSQAFQMGRRNVCN